MIYRFLALCVLAAAPAAAYVLHARPAVASQPPCALTARGACAGAPTRAAASMNLGDRFVRLVKSNVNQALGAMEDPEKVLEQAVADMQRDLTKVRQAYAEVSASSKRAEEQSKLAQAAARRPSPASAAVATPARAALANEPSPPPSPPSPPPPLPPSPPQTTRPLIATPSCRRWRSASDHCPGRALTRRRALGRPRRARRTSGTSARSSRLRKARRSLPERRSARQFRDASETLPRRYRDAWFAQQALGQTTQRRFRDTSETRPRRFGDASKTPRSTDTSETLRSPGRRSAAGRSSWSSSTT